MPQQVSTLGCSVLFSRVIVLSLCVFSAYPQASASSSEKVIAQLRETIAGHVATTLKERIASQQAVDEAKANEAVQADQNAKLVAVLEDQKHFRELQNHEHNQDLRARLEQASLAVLEAKAHEQVQQARGVECVCAWVFCFVFSPPVALSRGARRRTTWCCGRMPGTR